MPLAPLSLRGSLAILLLATFAGPCTHGAAPAWLDADAQQVVPEVVALRRDFHRNPELSNAEERTARVVAERLRNLGLEVRTGVAKHGVVALLKGGKPGSVVALRADMDALPIEETHDLPFKSLNKGVMHACGHDAHTAIGLGVAALLAKHRAEIPGTVKFLFQPAEESMPIHFQGDWGAKLMIQEGALDNPKPSAIFALHCQPLAVVVGASGQRQQIPFRAGMIGYGAGPISANSDSFSIAVRGKMAHGSTPHRGVDAIQVAAAIITELQTIRSRHTDAQEPVVVTVGTIKGGQRANILADHAEMTGTVRTHNVRVQEKVIALMEQIAKGIGEAHGAAVQVQYRKGYPASVNDAALVDRMLPVLRQVVGAENLLPALPSMGGEDFAYFAQKVPALYVRLGVARAGVEEPAGLHTPDFDLDESALLTGLRTMTALVWEALGEKAE
jgi:amidohydrolase